MPFFSIIIPTKTRPHLMDIALYSLHHQSFEDFEVIITDDYDDERISCKSIVEKYQDKRFVYVHPPDEPALGMCGNWAHGLRFASGKYIGFMQDKMYMYEESLENLHTCIMSENFPDMVNWGWDFYDLERKDGSSFAGIWYRMDWKNTWEARIPEEEIAKKLEFSGGSYQFPGGIPGAGSLLAGVVKKEILQRIESEFGSVFNFFNPDYGSPLLFLNTVESLIFHHDNLFAAIPLLESEGLRHATSYKAVCHFQDMSPCGMERLKYATVPYLRITNTNMVSADYNYTMQMLGRTDRCRIDNVLQGILRDAEQVHYERLEDYEKENARMKAFFHAEGLAFENLPQYEKRGQVSCDCTVKSYIRTLFFKIVPKRFQACIRNFLIRHNCWIYCQSPKESIFR